MKKLIMVVVFATGMTGVALATEPSAPEPGTATGSVAADETIVLVGKTTGFKVVDLGPKGESVGDLLVIREALLDENGDRVGRQVYRCMLQFKPDLQCDGSNVLKGRGQISFVNVVDTAGETHAPATITGGSGAFANVGGQMLIDTQQKENVYTLEILYLS
jgi:hypothetical protein